MFVGTFVLQTLTFYMMPNFLAGFTRNRRSALQSNKSIPQGKGSIFRLNLIRSKSHEKGLYLREEDLSKGPQKKVKVDLQLPDYFKSSHYFLYLVLYSVFSYLQLNLFLFLFIKRLNFIFFLSYEYVSFI